MPLIIAHRAGNDLTKLAEAFALGVDYAETDVWLHRGRLEVRHDKTAGPLPVLWDRWRLRPGWTRRLLLDDVLRAAVGQGELFLDLKGEEPGLPDVVAGALQRFDVADGVAFSSPVWWYLDQLAELVPQAPRFYTIGSPERLAELRPRLGRGEIAAISISSAIVTAEVILELRQAGAETIVTWGVETEDDARRVLGCGVSGVTSKDLALLAAVRQGDFGDGG